MATQKLTKGIREEVSLKVAKAAGLPKKDALVAQRNKAGIALFESLVGEEVIKTLRALPSIFTTTQQSFHLGVTDDVEVHKYENDGVKFDRNIEIEFGDYIVALNDRRRYNCHLFADHNNAFLVDYLSLSGQIDAIDAEMKELRGKVFALLSTITTVEKAMEMWPEGEEYLKEFAYSGVSGLPAIRIEDVNSLMTQLKAA